MTIDMDVTILCPARWSRFCQHGWSYHKSLSRLGKFCSIENLDRLIATSAVGPGPVVAASCKLQHWSWRDASLRSHHCEVASRQAVLERTLRRLAAAHRCSTDRLASRR